MQTDSNTCDGNGETTSNSKRHIYTLLINIAKNDTEQTHKHQYNNHNYVLVFIVFVYDIGIRIGEVGESYVKLSIYDISSGIWC